MYMKSLGPPLFIMVLLFSSCLKEDFHEEATQVQNALSVNNPTVTNNRLKFESIDHLQAYYQKLSELVQNDSLGDLQTVLSREENKFNYTSLRSVLNDSLAYSDRNPDPEDFLLDDIRESILNNEYEVQVDDEVYVYMSENQVYKFEESDTEQEALFENAPKGNDDEVDFSIVKPTTELLSEKFTKAVRPYLPPPENCMYESDFALERVNSCDNPLRYKLKGWSLIHFEDEGEEFTLFPVNNQFTIDWGDGSATDIVNDHEFSDLIHDFTSDGIFNVTITSTYFNVCDEVTDTDVSVMEEQISSGTCSEFNNSEQDFVWVAPQHKMECELWFKFDIFGDHQGAKTESWKLNGSWSKDKGYVFVKLFYRFRNDSTCLCFTDADFPYIFSSEDSCGDKESHCSNCKDRFKSETVNGYSNNLKINQLDVTSWHRVDNDGVDMQKTLQIDICD